MDPTEVLVRSVFDLKHEWPDLPFVERITLEGSADVHVASDCLV